MCLVVCAQTGLHTNIDFLANFETDDPSIVFCRVLLTGTMTLSMAEYTYPCLQHLHRLLEATFCRGGLSNEEGSIFARHGCCLFTLSIAATLTIAVTNLAGFISNVSSLFPSVIDLGYAVTK